MAESKFDKMPDEQGQGQPTFVADPLPTKTFKQEFDIVFEKPKPQLVKTSPEEETKGDIIKIALTDSHSQIFPEGKIGDFENACEESKNIVTLKRNEDTFGLGNHNNESSASADVAPVSMTKPRRTRVKERSILDVVRKVNIWRRLYSGVIRKSDGALVRYSLVDAAKKVGISKKSLDDYLL